MITESDISDNKNDLNKSLLDSFTNQRKHIEKFSIIAIVCLTAALFLFSFNQKLPGGLTLVAGIIIGFIIARKSFILNKNIQESVMNISSLNEKKDELIKNFSHKIRGPLTSLVLIVDMIMDLDLRKEQRELMDSFITTTNNMVSTVNELTMQSAGNMSYEHRKSINFNLIATIQNTIELYSLKDKVNIDFSLNKEEFDDFECFGDPILLNQIFLSLFNVIESSASEVAIRVKINLSKTKLTESESRISLVIQTDKRVILIDTLNVQQSRTSQLITTGKGTFSQELGTNSTTLTIQLPYTNSVFEPKQNSASSKIIELIQKDKTHKVLKNIKILLVEDNLINKNITLLTLKPLVSSIDTASNGKEALDMFGTSSYDLILMDIQMPIMNGLIAAEKIRALESTTNSHVPIIAITANAMIGDKEKCLAVGIDDYISKPFQPSLLVEKIKKYF
jgi:CheY-like chemotaxis protein